MLKILLFLLVLPPYVRADEGSPEAKPQWVYLEVAKDSRKDHGVIYRVGLIFSGQFMISYRGSQLNAERKESGGDLSTWNYVEQTYTSKSDRTAIELTYFFTPVTVREGGGHVTLGVGRSRDSLNYNYARYKPYNGAFCLIGPCDKALEEGDGGEASASYDFISLGLGYMWTIHLGGSGLNFKIGCDYTSSKSPDTYTLGVNRKATMSGISSEAFAVSLGLSIGIPRFL